MSVMLRYVFLVSMSRITEKSPVFEFFVKKICLVPPLSLKLPFWDKEDLAAVVSIVLLFLFYCFLRYRIKKINLIIDWFIILYCSFLHMNSNQVFIKVCSWFKVWFLYKWKRRDIKLCTEIKALKLIKKPNFIL